MFLFSRQSREGLQKRLRSRKFLGNVLLVFCLLPIYILYNCSRKYSNTLQKKFGNIYIKVPNIYCQYNIILCIIRIIILNIYIVGIKYSVAEHEAT